MTITEDTPASMDSVYRVVNGMEAAKRRYAQLDRIIAFACWLEWNPPSKIFS